MYIYDVIQFKKYKYEHFLSVRNIIAYNWDNLWERGHGDKAYKLANAGYKVCVSELHQFIYLHTLYIVQYKKTHNDFIKYIFRKASLYFNLKKRK